MSFADAWSAAFPQGMWILLVVSLVLCAIGFYKYVYFLSVGYGFAIAGEGVALLVMFRQSLTLEVVVLSLLFVCYGARLSGFLVYREWKSAGYRKTLNKVTETEKPMPIGVKLAIWLSVGVLYVAQVTPVYYRLANDKPGEGVCPWIGIILMIAGLLIESMADYQKSAQKKVNPHMVATQGLYRMVRCPNYFGEIVFWTGVFVSGWNVLVGDVQWLIAAIGYVCIVLIMINGAQRLETRQIKSYGDSMEYRNYADKTPILIPIIPVYHLAKNIEGKKEG